MTRLRPLARRVEFRKMPKEDGGDPPKEKPGLQEKQVRPEDTVQRRDMAETPIRHPMWRRSKRVGLRNMLQVVAAIARHQSSELQRAPSRP